MTLTKLLKENGYDLIEGPIRNHKPLQLWLKNGLNEAQIYYVHIDQALISHVVLTEIESPALNVNSTQKDEYGFNIGITFLEEILKSIGLGSFDITAKIKTGKKVTISYDNCITKEFAIGPLEEFFSTADFKHVNTALLKNLNQNNLLIITGAVFAKNLVVNIDTDITIDTNLVADLNSIAEGKIGFSVNNQHSIKMISSTGISFPIAVRANRIDFDKGSFKKLKLVTDTFSIF